MCKGCENPIKYEDNYCYRHEKCLICKNPVKENSLRNYCKNCKKI